MKYLLDTHILYWAINDRAKLSQEVKEIIVDIDNEIYISIVSEWELVIKSNIGKLKLAPNFISLAQLIDELDPVKLSISREHLDTYEKLPLHHRDPFDRMLIAQAKTEKLTIITQDRNFKGYRAKVLFNE